MSSSGSSPLGNLVIRVEGDSSPLEESLHKMEGSVSSFVEHVGAATAGLAAAFGLALLGEQAFEAAEKFEAATFTIQRATGATGEKLEGLEEVFKNVYQTTGQSANAVAGALAQLSIRTGLVGEDLDKLATANLNLTRVMGGDLKSNIEQTQKLFTQWGITVEQQPFKLDELTVASQKTGVNFQTLTSEMTTAGPVLRNLGFGFEESAALLGVFDQSGLGATRVISTLGVALATLSKTMKDPQAALRDLIAQIQAAPTSTEALRIAMSEGLSKKGALVVVDAFRLAKGATADIVKAMDASRGTVNDLADNTKSLGERWTIFQHVLESALIPLGKPLIAALTDGAKNAQAFVKEIQGLVDWFNAIPAPVKLVTAAIVGLPIVIELAVGAYEKLMALQVVIWLKALPAAITEITLSLTGMQGALSLGATRLLAFGQAGLVAAAAFTAWELGKWMRENIPWVQKLGDTMADVNNTFINWANGVAKKVQDSQTALQQTTDVLTQKLKEHGVEVHHLAGESLPSYNERLREAAVNAGFWGGAVQKGTGALKDDGDAHKTLHPLIQKTTQLFTDMKTSLDKMNISSFSSALKVTVDNVYQMVTAHEAWGKKIEYVTAQTSLSNDMLGLENEAMLQQVSGIQAVIALPLPEWYNDTTNGIYTANDAFTTLNVTTDVARDKQEQLILKAYDFVAAMHAVGAASDEEMAAATDAMETALSKLDGVFDQSTTSITKSGQTMGQQITKVIGSDLSKAISDIIFQTGKISDAFVKLGKDVVDIVLNHIIELALKPLLKSLDQVLAKIPGLGGVFGGGGGSSGGGGGGGGDSSGGAGGALSGGLAGWINVGVSALSGIVQGVEGARTNNLLGEIEVSTRYAWIALGQGDSSIAGWTHQTYNELTSMQTTLWAMRSDNGQIIDNLQQILAQIKAVAKMSTSVASGTNGGTVNFHPGSIVVQGSDSPQTVAENVARAIPRLMKARSSAFITQPAF